MRLSPAHLKLFQTRLSSTGRHDSVLEPLVQILACPSLSVAGIFRDFCCEAIGCTAEGAIRLLAFKWPIE